MANEKSKVDRPSFKETTPQGSVESNATQEVQSSMPGEKNQMDTGGK